jgi:lipopolysaccharide export system protein LptA
MPVFLSLNCPIFASLKKYLIFLTALAASVAPSFCQTQVELLGASELSGMESSGKKIQRLIGNVVLRHDKAIMRCDSAWLDKSTNSFEAFGKVNINESDSLILNGSYLKYEGNSKKALVSDRVDMSDGQMTLTTERLDYDLNTRTAHYVSGGHIVNQENTLDSKIGYYDANSKTFSFKQQVRLVNPEYIILCDTLIYNTQSKNARFFGPTTIEGKDGFIYCENGQYNTLSGKARFSRNAYIINSEYYLSADSLVYGGKEGIDTALSNVVLIDSINRLVINGNRGIYDRNASVAAVSGNALASVSMDDDSLHIGAETLKSIGDSSGKKSLYAYYRVKIFKTDIQGACDSLHYSQADSIIHLLTEPVLWSSEKQQLTADTIRIQLANSKPAQAFLIQSAMITEHVDSLLYNQLGGNMLTCWFENSRLRRAFVEGNAENIYFQQDDTLTVSSMNYIVCSDIHILLDSNNQLEEITYIREPNGTNYPIDRLPPPEDRTLKGFRWVNDRRPKSKTDLFVPRKKENNSADILPEEK